MVRIPPASPGTPPGGTELALQPPHVPAPCDRRVSLPFQTPGAQGWAGLIGPRHALDHPPYFRLCAGRLVSLHLPNSSRQGAVMAPHFADERRPWRAQLVVEPGSEAGCPGSRSSVLISPSSLSHPVHFTRLSNPHPVCLLRNCYHVCLNNGLVRWIPFSSSHFAHEETEVQRGCMRRRQS